MLLAICAVAVLASATVAATPYAATPRCDGVRLRTGPSATYPTKTKIDQTTTVTVAAEVAGSRWSTLCGGITYSGSTWAKVIAIDGTSTKDAYGVPALYAALGLLRPTTPTTTSSPPQTAAPTASPSATAAPSTVPPDTAPPSASEPSSSPGPTSSSQASPPGSSRPSGGAAGPIDSSGPLSSVGSPDELVILALALASVTLAGIAYRERRRRDRERYMAKVESSRLKDILE